MKIEDAKRKVRSLLEISKKGSGATEAERDTAGLIARRIMKSHGLDISDIPGRKVEVERPIQAAPMGDVVFVHTNVYVVNVGAGLGSFGFSFTEDGTTTTGGF